MQGMKRRVVYITSYEIIGMGISSLCFALLTGSTLSHTGPLAILVTSMAALWNLVYNLMFEAWERRQTIRTRTVKRRIAHAIGLQLTLIVFLIPLIAWWMEITLLKAFILDASLIVIIPFYTFTFNWIFDQLFGVPLSAQPIAK